jgi:hypothetical protein
MDTGLQDEHRHSEFRRNQVPQPKRSMDLRPNEALGFDDALQALVFICSKQIPDACLFLSPGQKNNFGEAVARRT